MKMTPSKIFICLFLLFSACTGSPKSDHPYTSNGLTMKLPPYWNVIKDKTDSAAGTRLITIEDKNPTYTTGAYLVISEVNDTVDLNHALQTVIRTTTASLTKRNVPIKLVSEPEALSIGNAQALRIYFECPIPNELNTGTFTVFRLNGKTYTFVFTVAGKNSEEKIAPVDRIIRSLRKYNE